MLGPHQISSNKRRRATFSSLQTPLKDKRSHLIVNWMCFELMCRVVVSPDVQGDGRASTSSVPPLFPPNPQEGP